MLQQWLGLSKIDCTWSVDIDVLKERQNWILELGDLLLEDALLLLSHLVDKVVEFECLLVVNAHDLVGSRLQNCRDATQRCADLDVESEFGALELLVLIYKFPNLEFVFVESRSDNVTRSWVSFLSLTANQVWRLIQFLDGGNAGLAVAVGVHILNDLLEFDAPDFHLSSFSTDNDKVFVNLEKCCWWAIVFNGPGQSASSSFQINVADNSQTFSVVRHAKHRARTLD